MHSVVILLILGVVQVTKGSSNNEVDVLMNQFSAVSAGATAHAPDLTGEDIYALGQIKLTIFELIKRKLLTPTGQTYPWYGGMHLEFYKCKSDNPFDKDFVVLPATSDPTARADKGAPPNWAYDENGKKYFDLRDGDKPVAQVYFK